MLALVIGFCYFFCPKMSDIQLPFLQRPTALEGGPGPNYQPISAAEGFNYDSGDDEMPDSYAEDDPAGRSQPVELQSFSGRSTQNESQARELPRRNPIDQNSQ